MTIQTDILDTIITIHWNRAREVWEGMASNEDGDIFCSEGTSPFRALSHLMNLLIDKEEVNK